MMSATPSPPVADKINRAFALSSIGRFEDAEQMLWSALELAPEDPNVSFRLALSLLHRGDYARAWPLYERRPVQIPGAPPGRPTLNFPEWSGEPISSLLILPEQGLGDQIQLTRYVSLLAARGVEVTLLAPPPLARLFSGLRAEVVTATGRLAIPRRDAWTLITSLPYRLSTTLGTIPPPASLPSGPGGGGIGVMTKGNPGHPNDHHRSLPQPLAEELSGLPGAIDLDPAVTGAADFEDTRRIIAGLDRVITVDTAVAHLAASMGKPTWILLPFVGCDWRWSREGAASPWYPSARLFRQPAAGAWEGALADVRAALG